MLSEDRDCSLVINDSELIERKILRDSEGEEEEEEQTSILFGPEERRPERMHVHS